MYIKDIFTCELLWNNFKDACKKDSPGYQPCHCTSNKGHKFSETLVCKIWLTMFKFQSWLWVNESVEWLSDVIHWDILLEWVPNDLPDVSYSERHLLLKIDQKLCGCVSKQFWSPEKYIATLFAKLYTYVLHRHVKH